jgi:hypothetical protein
LKNSFLLISLLLLTSCTTFFKKKTERVIARVDEDYLYESDIKSIIPPGTLPKDSLVLTGNYIDSWIRQKLIIHQAYRNLTGDQLDFSRQLEDYKNSLIIFRYENALVSQKLDTLVTDEEITSYYDTNQQNFLLKENIVLIQYVKLPVGSTVTKQIKKLLVSDNLDDKNKLDRLCEDQAADYYLDDQNWLFFNDLVKQVPIKTYNQEEYLKNHRDIELQDSLFIYLVRVRDFRIKESVSPLSLEKHRIREIILNKRKIEMLKRMHEDIYSSALKNNEFEIY